MKAQFFTLLAVCLLPTVMSEGSSADYTTWSHTVVEHCNGTQQSPVNIVTTDVKEDASLTAFNFTGFDDNSTVLQIQNADGKSVKVGLDDSKMSVSGGGLPGVYKTQQMHLHWGNGSSAPGSEHTVNGKQYPMELHIVNMKSTHPNISVALGDSTGLAVLGFFIEATNDTGYPESWKNLTSYLSSIPNKGDTVDIMYQFTMDSLLQGVDRTKYYRYLGSLTTPSCNEAVVWTVFKEPIKVSQDLVSLVRPTDRDKDLFYRLMLIFCGLFRTTSANLSRFKYVIFKTFFNTLEVYCKCLTLHIDAHTGKQNTLKCTLCST
uniref:Carbonic anhydrase n=1 Tax=Astyanax mexicanus TaxID=7994 RepID=A0A8B9KF24_ASTMX